ncbi:hypothetical protein K3495_g8591 [Podosphaera aphanis]|nr:hypothetical protein K3495_g8591 [Podosphaera aphanis]
MQMTKSLTITSLALKILYTKFNNEKLLLPHILNQDIYLEIKKSYYGGRVEVYRPYGQKLYYYDVNSLYPFAAINKLPGLNASKVEYFDYNPDINKLFGFFYCKITTSTNSEISKYFGLLPHRDLKELKFALKQGYQIRAYKGYLFEEQESPLKDFIQNVYLIKAKAKNKAERQIGKSIINNSTGRFGMDPEKPISNLVDLDGHNLIMTTRTVFDSKAINDNLFLDTYLDYPNKEQCTKFGLDYIKVRNIEKYKENRKEYNDFSSISTASAILSYSRIYMAKAILYVLNNGGKIYYTDTDSLVIDIKLPED